MANDGSYGLVYTAGQRDFALDLSSFNAESISAMWFDPRTNELSSQNAVTKSSEVNFTTPEKGDWVLVLGR